MRNDRQRLTCESLERRDLLTISYFDSGDLVLVGTDDADTATVRNIGSFVEVRLGAERQAHLREHVTRIVFFGRGGDDTFTNNSTVPSLALGGAGDDTLIGGSAADRLFGDSGFLAFQPIGLADLNAVRNNFGKLTPLFENGGDFNHDGVVDLRDLNLVRNNVGRVPGDSQLAGGHDKLFGRQGIDALFGERGRDSLFGGDDDDDLYGGRDDDTLDGGDGDDYMVGESTAEDLVNTADILTPSAGDDFAVGTVELQGTSGSIVDEVGLGLSGRAFIEFIPSFSNDARWDDASFASLRTSITNALNDLESVFLSSFDGEAIRIRFRFLNPAEERTDLLASARPHYFVTDAGGAELPVALANHLDRKDSDSSEEILVAISATEYLKDLGIGLVNYRSTVIHEITHGLGFLGPQSYKSYKPKSQLDWLGQPTLPRPSYFKPSKFATFIVTDTGRRFFDDMEGLRDGKDGDEDVRLLWSGQLGLLSAPNGEIEIHAPDPFKAGSSISHVAEDNSATKKWIMSPRGDFSENAFFTQAELGMLADLGWDIYDALLPTEQGRLHRVNTDSGAPAKIKVNQAAEWSGATSMTSLDNHLYVIQDNTLWRVDADGRHVPLGTPGAWSGVTFMAAMADSIYVLQDNNLHRVDPANGNWSIVGSRGDWASPSSMTALGNRLYIIENGSLWRVNPTSSSIDYFTRLGRAGDWNGPTLMTAAEGELYIVQNNTLYAVNPATGDFSRRGNNGDWALNASSIAAIDNHVYIVENRRLWRVNLNNGHHVQIGDEDWWPGLTRMTSFEDGSLYIIRATS